MFKTLRYYSEYGLLRIIAAYFGSMTMAKASNHGAWLAQKIGPLLSPHSTAMQNLTLAFPEKTKEEKQQIIAGMWDNLGRVCGELPHLNSLSKEQFLQQVKLKNESELKQYTNSNKAVFFISAHFGNWELLSRLAYEYAMPSATVYRAPNNPYVYRYIQSIRERYVKKSISKGKLGAKELIKSIQDGDPIGILVDQKMNDGIPVPFFGHPAMTAPTVATLSLKYDIPIVPVRILRIDGMYYEAELFPQITIQPTNDQKHDVVTLMQSIHNVLEDWIRQYPKQWFWVHNRWPKGTNNHE